MKYLGRLLVYKYLERFFVKVCFALFLITPNVLADYDETILLLEAPVVWAQRLLKSYINRDIKIFLY